MFVKFFSFFVCILILAACNISNVVSSNIADKFSHKSLQESLNKAESGNCKVALEEISTSNIDHNNYEDIILLAKIYKFCNEFDKVQLCLEEAIKLSLKDSNPKVDAFEMKGILLLEKGEFYAAQQIFTSILERDASRWKVVNCLGISLEAQDKLHEALEYFIIAKNLSNGHYSVLNNIALILAKLKDYDQALFTINEALKKTSQTEIIKRLNFNKSLILSQSGRSTEALDILKKYLTNQEVQQNKMFYLKMQ